MTQALTKKKNDSSARLRRLRRHLQGRALWLTHGPDVRYLTGFTGSNAVVLVLPRSTVLLTDGRYIAQAGQETEGTGIRVKICRPLVGPAMALLLRAGAESVLYDTAHTTVAQLDQMQTALKEAQTGKSSATARRRFFEPLPEPLLPMLREIKDAAELAQIEAAARIGCSLFEAILPHLQPGTPERVVGAQLEFEARRLGADGMSFETIIASGRRSSMPHGHATGQPLPRRGFVTLDFGVILGGYCSDMTRTVCMGRPTREERTAYDAVLEAEQAGVAAIAAGIAAGAVDHAARSVLKRHGLDKHFTHSTGHGVGLEIHETPMLAARSEKTLAEGMVLTVEPGVYLPGQFGVRIEDMVVVEAKGSRVLTPAPTALLSL